MQLTENFWSPSCTMGIVCTLSLQPQHRASACRDAHALTPLTLLLGLHTLRACPPEADCIPSNDGHPHSNCTQRLSCCKAYEGKYVISTISYPGR